MKTMQMNTLTQINGGLTYNQVWNEVKKQAKNDWKAIKCIWGKALKKLPKYFTMPKALVVADVFSLGYKHFFSQKCGCY